MNKLKESNTEPVRNYTDEEIEKDLQLMEQKMKPIIVMHVGKVAEFEKTTEMLRKEGFIVIPAYDVNGAIAVSSQPKET